MVLSPISLAELEPNLGRHLSPSCKTTSCFKDMRVYFTLDKANNKHRWPMIPPPHLLKTCQFFVSAELNSERVLVSLPCCNSLELSLPCMFTFVQCNFCFDTTIASIPKEDVRDSIQNRICNRKETNRVPELTMKEIPNESCQSLKA